MREGAAKQEVVIPTVDDIQRPSWNADRPLWALNRDGKRLIERRSARPWDGVTIPTERFVVK